jgi:hypothetical protein
MHSDNYDHYFCRVLIRIVPSRYVTTHQTQFLGPPENYPYSLSVMTYSDLSKRRRIRDIRIQNITADTPFKGVFMQRCKQDDDITVSSTSSLSSECNERSMFSLQTNESNVLQRQHGRLSQPSFVQKCKTKKVTFTTVEVRQYAVVLADYQDCNYPMCLDWGHTKSHIMRIDDFDVVRKSGPCPLDAKERLKRLLKMGYRSIELELRERDRKIRLSQEPTCESKYDGVLLPPHIKCKEVNLVTSKY